MGKSETVGDLWSKSAVFDNALTAPILPYLDCAAEHRPVRLGSSDCMPVRTDDAKLSH